MVGDLVYTATPENFKWKPLAQEPTACGHLLEYMFCRFRKHCCEKNAVTLWVAILAHETALLAERGSRSTFPHLHFIG